MTAATNPLPPDGGVAIEESRLFRGNNKAIAVAMAGIVHELRDWWPLTVRQAYYQCVTRGVFTNHDRNYQKTSKMLTKLRRADLLPWRAIEDRTRRTIDKRGVANVQKFASEQLSEFLDRRYYHRCYIQEQDVYAEVVIEKDALSTIVSDAVWMYCTRVAVIRGQSSATAINELAERMGKAIMKGKTPIILYAGDLDPTGIQIPKSVQNTLFTAHGLDVELRRIALNPDQLTEFNLPESIDAAKVDDPNYQRWVDEFGRDGVKPTELDALKPADLKAIVESALQDVYDMSEMSEQQKVEQQERERLHEVKQEIEDLCFDNWPDLFNGASYGCKHP